MYTNKSVQIWKSGMGHMEMIEFSRSIRRQQVGGYYNSPNSCKIEKIRKIFEEWPISQKKKKTQNEFFRGIK